MRMRKIAALILALAATPGAAAAITEVECSDRPECWPEGSSMHTGLLLAAQRKETEKLLAAAHAKLIDLVSSATSSDEQSQGNEMLLEALKTQQSAWQQYQTDECRLVGAMTGAGGTWPGTYQNECMLKLTGQRLGQVQSVIACIRKIPGDKRRFEQNECMQPLVPLANALND
jgi:uncharacterized protein YecT (DUF1311 family)